MRKSIPVLVIVTMFSCAAQAQSHTPPAATLNHVAVYVVNLASSTAFYHSVIGLDTIPEPFHDGKHTWFSIGPKSHLHLIEGAKQATQHDKNTHLCFTVQSVSSFIAVLNSNHIEFENWAGDKGRVTNRADGVQQLYFKDPDGYWIEINDARN